MDFPRINPVANSDELRERISAFFSSNSREKRAYKKTSNQLTISEFECIQEKTNFASPSQDIRTFLNFINSAISNGDVYLFGGMLRDIAIFGKSGFYSDIDIVIEGDWDTLIPYFHSTKAIKNKYGGYRLLVDKWPVDVWQAKETWAIKQGLVKYKDIFSLTDTTILNWDGILMNWRTKVFIHKKEYFEDINKRTLKVVLTENPNPIGTIVRVFRHLYHKDAAKITIPTIHFIVDATCKYSYHEIKKAELSSYGNSIIEPHLYMFFNELQYYSEKEVKLMFDKNFEPNCLRNGLLGQLAI